MTISRALKTHLFLLLCVAVLQIAGSCRLIRAFNVTREVPEGKFLLKKNELTVEGDNMDVSAMEQVIRQQPNLSGGGIKWRLIAYNWIDSAKVVKRRTIISNRWKRKNERRIAREIRINTHRRDRALAKGDSTYFYKRIQLKDTQNVRLSIHERIKYKFGEAPVIVDTTLFNKSKTQLNLYMHKKGYYFDTVTGYLDTLGDGRKKKIVAHFKVVTGPRYYIDSFYVVSSNQSVLLTYMDTVNKKYGYLVKERGDSPLNEPLYKKLILKDTAPLRIPFDQDVLAAYKDKIALYMRNNAFYGFSPAHIKFTADTSSADMRVKLRMEFTDRIIPNPSDPDNPIVKKHAITEVQAVYFYYSDTTSFPGNFADSIKSLQLSLRDDRNNFTVIDTFFYNKLVKKVRLPDDQQRFGNRYYKSAYRKNLFGGYKDSVDVDRFRTATFLYNGKMFIKPGVVEAQNYLEFDNYYKEYYVDRSYNRLMQLGVFNSIRPVIEEVPGNKIVVRYYLTPQKKQSYGFEPRATNSNGFLGVAASVNYNNKNLFRSAWNTTVSFSGGFESQPPVFGEQDGQTIQKSARSFNTFEFGPTLKFDLPGLFPVSVEKLDKRQRPRTVLSAAYNFQQRPDFSREVFQLNYLWKFFVAKTQVISVGLPGASVIKFVSMDPKPAFEQRIAELNDLFLRNAYSNQFIWEDLKFVFEYDNLNADKKPERLRLVSSTTFNTAGNLLYFGFRGSQEKDSLDHYQLFGVPYSQFALLDTRFTATYNVNRKHQVASRVMAGVGVPYLNTKTSLPYDYAFFAGGANDNRGWVARSLGPGAYKYYLDPERPSTQIGDIRIAGSIEYRLGRGRLLQSAVFMDAGNIWTINNDTNRKGGQFSRTWYKELGIAAGYGIRLDFSFFIVRCDVGFPLHNPGLPEGSRWIWDSRDQYNQEILNSGMTAEEIKKIPAPFFPRFNIGIGLPF